MPKLDPFLYPIPQNLDPELRDFFEYFVRWAHDVGVRLGIGSNDKISDADTAELFPWQSGNSIENSATLHNFKTKQVLGFVPVFGKNKDSQRPFFTVASNHTCYGPEIIEATSNISVFLDSEPGEAQLITVKRNTAAGAVTVDGNGNNIDGAATYSLAANYDSVNVIFNGSEWLTI